MVVEVGFTVVDPTRVDVLKLPGVMATEEAFVIFQLSVLVSATATMEDEAEKEETEGALVSGAGAEPPPVTTETPPAVA